MNIYLCIYVYVYMYIYGYKVAQLVSLVYQRVNINGNLHVQGLNCSNPRGDGTITSLDRHPEIDQLRCNLLSGT